MRPRAARIPTTRRNVTLAAYRHDPITTAPCFINVPLHDTNTRQPSFTAEQYNKEETKKARPTRKWTTARRPVKRVAGVCRRHLCAIWMCECGSRADCQLSNSRAGQTRYPPTLLRERPFSHALERAFACRRAFLARTHTQAIQRVGGNIIRMHATAY